MGTSAAGAVGPGNGVPRVELAPGYSIARVINGGWQLAADHSGRAIDRRAVVDGCIRLAEAGFTTFDCADIYTGVEELFGDFTRAWRDGGRDPAALQIHTKFVPDLDSLADLGRASIESAIDRSLSRLGVERLDLVQFHWWDAGVPGFVEMAGSLDELRRAGKIRCLAVTNVDVTGTSRLLDAGIPIVANQVQYSLLDRRPENGMVELGAAHDVHLLCYGALAGGFLSERYRGAPPPDEPLTNRSLTKYHLIIEEYGGWAAYQRLLAAAAEIAARHRVSVANVAARWVLDRPGVAAVILGARTDAHLRENLRLFEWQLDGEDRRRIGEVQVAHPGPAGDIYALERDRQGRHWAILRTGLHEVGAPEE